MVSLPRDDNVLGQHRTLHGIALGAYGGVPDGSEGRKGVGNVLRDTRSREVHVSAVGDGEEEAGGTMRCVSASVAEQVRRSIAVAAQAMWQRAWHRTRVGG
eukprot:3169922-Rhodomonas_salina.2